jgi:hypothetical protein
VASKAPITLQVGHILIVSGGYTPGHTEALRAATEHIFVLYSPHRAHSTVFSVNLELQSENTPNSQIWHASKQWVVKECLFIE